MQIDIEGRLYSRGEFRGEHARLEQLGPELAESFRQGLHQELRSRYVDFIQQRAALQ